MSRQWYGSLENRLEENRMFCEEIKVGMGMTEYSYSDRQAYEVIKVIDQKHVFVRKYDHKAVGEPMSNEWELVSNPNNPEIEMVFRYGSWHSVSHWNQKKIDDIIARNGYFMDWHGVREKLKNKAEVKTYSKMNVSFGKADYYYDYSF